MSWANRFPSLRSRASTAIAVVGVIVVTGILLTAHGRDAGIDAIRQRGELVVAIRQGPASYYLNSFGQAGFEYDLAQGFARDLGVSLKLVSVDSAEEGLELVNSGKVDLAVGEAQTVGRTKQFAFSVPVQSVTQHVVCAASRERPLPATVTELANRRLVVTAGSHHLEQLADLRAAVPEFTWQSLDGASEENLLGHVHQQQADCAVVDATEWEFQRHLFPDLQVAFDLPKPTLFGWALARGRDSSLRTAANAYLASRLTDGTVAALQDRYFAHLQTLTRIDGKRFYKAVRYRLPTYVDAFREEAARNDIDWRLLAAVAYQESLWDPAAQSPTGVQGLMQLTLDTAMELGIDDRTDPIASIKGGARYLRQILNQLPADIPEADRTWMALAAYNAGVAHVQDARELTRKRGGNPNAWADVRANLALLKQERWYSQTRYGYARGATQAIIYVRHVSRYYDLLVLASNSASHGEMMLAMGGSAAHAATAN